MKMVLYVKNYDLKEAIKCILFIFLINIRTNPSFTKMKCSQIFIFNYVFEFSKEQAFKTC